MQNEDKETAQNEAKAAWSVYLLQCESLQQWERRREALLHWPTTQCSTTRYAVWYVPLGTDASGKSYRKITTRLQSLALMSMQVVELRRQGTGLSPLLLSLHQEMTRVVQEDAARWHSQLQQSTVLSSEKAQFYRGAL